MAGVGNVKQRNGSAMSLGAHGHEAVAQRMNVRGQAGHLQLAGNGRVRRIAEVHDPERVNYQKGDDISTRAVKARGEEAFATAQFHFAELDGSSGESERGSGRRKVSSFVTSGVLETSEIT